MNMRVNLKNLSVAVCDIQRDQIFQIREADLQDTRF